MPNAPVRFVPPAADPERQRYFAQRRDRLIELVKVRALRQGSFTLASGRSSHYYLDGKHITLDAQGLQLAVSMLWDLLQPGVQAVGGLVVGADPLVGGLLFRAGSVGKELKGFLVRKVPKDHGTCRWLEGAAEPGQTAAVVEDVVTTGASALLAVQKAKEFGLEVQQVLGLVDRLEGGGEAIRAAGLRFDSVLTVRDLGIEPLPPPGP